MFKLIISGIILVFGFIGNVWSSSVSVPWNKTDIQKFLKEQNRSEAILINSLVIKQGKDTIPLYEHIGNEELHLELQQRPILKKTDPTGPFVRGNDFTLLVDRGQGLELEIDLKIIHALYNKSGQLSVEQNKVDKLIYWLKPGDKKDEEHWLKEKDNSFKLLLSNITFIKEIILEIRQPQSGHQIIFTLISKKKPVTIENTVQIVK